MNNDATITEAAIEKAFKLMIERPDIKATIRIYYQQDSDSELSRREISIGGGSGSVMLEDESVRTFLNEARKNSDNSSDQYTGDLLMVHACVNNPVQKVNFITELAFKGVYCSSFFAARRK
jgi:UDP-N-acetylenolpyruvoylglucosamine reductase